MNEFDEIPEAIEILRAVIAELELEALSGSKPETALVTIREIISLAVNYGRVVPRPGAPSRGLGYDFDDAQIVASLPEHGNSLEKAVRHHWQRDDDDWLDEGQIETIIKRIRKRTRDIEAVEGGT